MIFGIIGIASLLGSTFGFGFGLIGMPLMVLVLEVKSSAGLIAISSLFLSLFIFIKGREELDFKVIWKLIAGSMVGIPIGIYFLKGSDDSVMKTMLALMIILFALYSLFGKLKMTLKADWPAYIFGLISGIINGAFVMGGPPVIIFGTLKKWPPATFRVNVYSHYLPLSLMIVFSYWTAGLITRPVVTHAALSLPIIVITVIIGDRLNRSIPTKQFNTIIHVALMLIGFLLLYKVIAAIPATDI